MAVALKSEVKVDLGGGEELTAKLTMNALCSINDETGSDAMELLEEFQKSLDAGKVDFKKLRYLFKTVLLYGKKDITELEAGDLMDRIGLPATVQTVMQCLSIAFPVYKKKEGAEASQDNSPLPGSKS